MTLLSLVNLAWEQSSTTAAWSVSIFLSVIFQKLFKYFCGQCLPLNLAKYFCQLF